LKIFNRILQIVPRAPGPHEGVGDYALNLAERLSSEYEMETIFAAAETNSSSRVGNFAVITPLDATVERACADCRSIVLHYVNYGYHKRGLPVRLPLFLRRLRAISQGRLITIFHELYASSAPWRSAFWLQRWQKSIARKVVRVSDACVVSSEVMRDMLLQVAPGTTISVHPVVSTLGEPAISPDQFVRRDPHRWAIFGGTHLIKRSLNSFRRSMDDIPDSLAPRELFILGGRDDDEMRREIDQIRNMDCYYHPAVEADFASQLLSSCSFGWIDYFHHPDVPAAVILKSGSFASYCAHGVVPVFPHAASEISLRGDSLPGPYFVETNRTNLPALTDRAKLSADIYEWYQRYSSIEHLARGIVAALHLERA
jgi:hypothetical protein